MPEKCRYPDVTFTVQCPVWIIKQLSALSMTLFKIFDNYKNFKPLNKELNGVRVPYSGSCCLQLGNGACTFWNQSQKNSIRKMPQFLENVSDVKCVFFFSPRSYEAIITKLYNCRLCIFMLFLLLFWPLVF